MLTHDQMKFEVIQMKAQAKIRKEGLIKKCRTLIIELDCIVKELDKIDIDSITSNDVNNLPISDIVEDAKNISDIRIHLSRDVKEYLAWAFRLDMIGDKK